MTTLMINPESGVKTIDPTQVRHEEEIAITTPSTVRTRQTMQRYTAAEEWARSVGRGTVRRNAEGVLTSHGIGGMFEFSENTSLAEAWDKVEGHRVDVGKFPAYSMVGGKMNKLDGRFWMYSTIDGEPPNPGKPIIDVSNRYEMVRPSDVVRTVNQHFHNADGSFYPVVAIAFDKALRRCVIQFETQSIRLIESNDDIRRFLTICIPVHGAVVAGAIDSRFWCMNMMPNLIRNASIRIPHNTGANDEIQKRFESIVEQLAEAQSVQAELYSILSRIPAKPGDVERVLRNVYPYKALPDGYNQNTSPERILELTDKQNDWEGLGNLVEIPRSNRSAAQSRIMAYHGYEKARERTGDTLWAVCQTNYDANHRETKTMEAKVSQLLVQGPRRNHAIKCMTHTMAIALERCNEHGLDLPPSMKGIAERFSRENRDFNRRFSLN